MDILVNNNWCRGILGYLCLVAMVGCAKPNQSFIMPVPEIFPEERNVLTAVPVIPVDINSLD